jgi:hypothetical protein
MNHSTEVHHGQPVSHGKHIIEVVRNDEHRDTSVCEATDQRQYLSGL